jgi:hypothetical protein
MKRLIEVVLIILFVCSDLFSENWEVREQSSSYIRTYNIEINTTKEDSYYKTVFDMPSKKEIILYNLDNGAFYKDEDDGKIIIVRNGNSLKVQNKILSCPNLPWYGNFPIAVKVAVLSKRKSTNFIVLDETKNEITIMKASISYSKDNFPIVKISLAGLGELIWSVIFYTNQAGDIIKYVGNNGPGTEKVVQEYHLIEDIQTTLSK